jgi:hypothetical protein
MGRGGKREKAFPARTERGKKREKGVDGKGGWGVPRKTENLSLSLSLSLSLGLETRKTNGESESGSGRVWGGGDTEDVGGGIVRRTDSGERRGRCDVKIIPDRELGYKDVKIFPLHLTRYMLSIYLKNDIYLTFFLDLLYIFKI